MRAPTGMRVPHTMRCIATGRTAVMRLFHTAIILTTLSMDTFTILTKDTAIIMDRFNSPDTGLDQDRAATRDTRQRRAIRNAFLHAGRPLDPSEVLGLAAGEHGGLGIATVYRNIKMLVEEGWLIPVELPGRNTHYEVAGKEHHHHFYCSTCGKVFELMACLPDVQLLAPLGFEVTGHDLVLYGHCQNCARSQRETMAEAGG
jgi:Fur family ferric uptake transcriptional regulator